MPDSQQTNIFVQSDPYSITITQSTQIQSLYNAVKHLKLIFLNKKLNEYWFMYRQIKLFFFILYMFSEKQACI